MVKLHLLQNAFFFLHVKTFFCLYLKVYRVQTEISFNIFCSLSQFITSPTSGPGTTASVKPIRTCGPTRQEQTDGHAPENDSHHFFLPPVFLPCLPFPNCFLLLNMAFFLLSVLTSRPRSQSSRCTSHFSCLTPEDEEQKIRQDCIRRLHRDAVLNV